MYLSTVAAMLVPLLAAASPILRRAGGPTIAPIPPNCTIINPLPHAVCNSTTSGWMPKRNFTMSHELYAAYFTKFDSSSNQARQCQEQCYGYGSHGACKSAFLAYQVPSPPAFGLPGGDLTTACSLYDTVLTPQDFVVALVGQYVDETAGNIYCPT